MITSDNVKALVDAITALIAAESADKKALEDAQTLNATLKTSVVEFNDPALQSSVDAALSAAAAATSASATQSELPVPPPEPSPAPESSPAPSEPTPPPAA